MTRLEWQGGEQSGVWNVKDGIHLLTVVGNGVDTFGCDVDGKSIGQRGTLQAAQEWCEHIAAHLAPRECDGELHLWTFLGNSEGRFVSGWVFGDRRFENGKDITTAIIDDVSEHSEGTYITTKDSFYLLASIERSAALILRGYEAEAVDMT
jgi:hypothetical protein